MKFVPSGTPEPGPFPLKQAHPICLISKAVPNLTDAAVISVISANRDM
jgi:hypothetical protein